MKKPVLSLVIPCYNEEESIPQLAERLQATLQQLQEKYKIELILIDDGSTDQTPVLLLHHFGKQAYAQIVTHESNKNLGAAVRTGFFHASGDLVAVFDSDCTYDPLLLPTLVGMIDEQTDIATVSPYHPQGKVINVPAYRIFLSKSVSRIYRKMLGSHLYTYTAMVRVYKKEVTQKISFSSDTFLGMTEILVKALLHGYRVKELPAELQARKFGISKMKTVKVMKNHANLISKIALHKIFGTPL